MASEDVAALIVRLEARIGQFERDLDRARRSTDRGMNRIDRRIRSSSRAFNGLARSVAQYAAAAGAALSAQAVIGYADAYTRATNTLGLYQDQLGETSKAYERLYQTAQATRSSFDSVSGLAVRAAESVEATTDEYYAFAEATSIASQIASTSTESAARSIAQLGQAIGSSRVQAEEFNSVVEGTPRLARAAAEGILGVGAKGGDLQRLIRNGENFSGDQLFQAIISQLPKLRQEFETTEMTVDQALTKLDSAFGKYIGQQNAAAGASAMLARGIEALADNLEEIGDAFIVIGAVLAGRATPALVGMGVAALAGGTRIALLTRAVGILGVQATASAVAARGLNAALAFFGGPVGLAVTALAGGIAYLATKSSEAQEASERHRNAMEKIHALNGDLVDSTGKAAEAKRRETEELRKNTVQQLENLRARLKAQDWLEGVGGDGVIGDGVRTLGALASSAGVYSTSTDLRREIANLEAQISAIESGAIKESPAFTGEGEAVKPGGGLEADTKAAEKLRTEIGLLQREYERYLKVAQSRGLSADDDGAGIENPAEYEAELQTRLDRARTNAAKGLEQETVKRELVAIAVERVRARIEAAAKSEEDRAKAAADIAEAEADAAKDRQQAFARDVKAAQDKKKSLNEQQAAVEEAIAAVKQQMADEIVLQSARAQGAEQEKEARRQIEARTAATRLASEAQKAGLDITKEALQAEILASKEAVAAANERADAMERNRATIERIAELQRELGAGATGSSGAGVASVSGASTIEELDAILERQKEANRQREMAAEIAEAEFAVQKRIADASAEEVPLLQQELALVRQKVELKYQEAKAVLAISTAEKERRAELERAKKAEARIKEAASGANEASRRAEIEASAASAALDAQSLNDLAGITKAKEAQLRALERELAIKQAIEGLGDGATQREVSLVTAEAGKKFDNTAIIKDENSAFEKQKKIIGEIENANKKIVDGIFSAIDGAKSFEDALKKVGLQLIKVVASGFFNGAAGVSGAGQSGGTLGGLAANIGSSLLGGIFGGFRENGGAVQAGRAYVVGEKRPELFVPSTSGMIVPSVPTIGGSGSSSSTVNNIRGGDINIQGGVGDTPPLWVDQLRNGIVDDTIAKINQQQQAGLA